LQWLGWCCSTPFRIGFGRDWRGSSQCIGRSKREIKTCHIFSNLFFFSCLFCLI
jgi:hypothetical protein